MQINLQQMMFWRQVNAILVPFLGRQNTLVFLRGAPKLIIGLAVCIFIVQKGGARPEIGHVIPLVFGVSCFSICENYAWFGYLNRCRGIAIGILGAKRWVLQQFLLVMIVPMLSCAGIYVAKVILDLMLKPDILLVSLAVSWIMMSIMQTVYILIGLWSQRIFTLASVGILIGASKLMSFLSSPWLQLSAALAVVLACGLFALRFPNIMGRRL